MHSNKDLSSSTVPCFWIVLYSQQKWLFYWIQSTVGFAVRKRFLQVFFPTSWSFEGPCHCISTASYLCPTFSRFRPGRIVTWQWDYHFTVWQVISPVVLQKLCKVPCRVPCILDPSKRGLFKRAPCTQGGWAERKVTQFPVVVWSWGFCYNLPSGNQQP